MKIHKKLFDEVATLCYDLIDQKRAYGEFISSLQLINTPGPNFMVDSQKQALAGRYESLLKDIPPAAQSINYVTYALREAVVQVLDDIEEEQVETKDNTLNDLIADALEGLDVGDNDVEIPQEHTEVTTQAAGDENLFYKK